MKIVFALLFATGLLAIMTGCANDSSASSQGDRIGGRAGVTTSSRNLSGVTPERGNPTQAAN